MQRLLTHLPAEHQETDINGNADGGEAIDELNAGQSSSRNLHEERRSLLFCCRTQN